MKKKNPVLKGVLGAIYTFVIILAIHFIRAKITGEAFDPEWMSTIPLSVACGVIFVFAPSKEQAKKNRENLANKFKGKDN